LRGVSGERAWWMSKTARLMGIRSVMPNAPSAGIEEVGG
jgi:hypothetical protein